MKEVQTTIEVTKEGDNDKDIIIITLKLPLEKIKEATGDVRSSTRACI